MELVKRILAVVGSVIGSFFIVVITIFGFLYHPSESESGSVVFLVLIAMFGIPVIVGVFTYKKMKYNADHPEIVEARKKEKEEKERARDEHLAAKKKEKESKKVIENQRKIAEKVNNEQIKGLRDVSGQLKLIGGLGDLPTGTSCKTLCNSARMKFSASGQDFVLETSKLLDVSVMTQTEIQKQYVSSVGGAVAGAVLLGPIGAIIGGRASKKTVNNTSKYLVIAYVSEGETKYIVFDVTNNFFGNSVKNKYKYLKKQENIRVEL